VEEVTTFAAPVAKQSALTFDEEEEDALTLRICTRRGWRTVPTQNPHVMRALIKELNPWKARAFDSASQVSQALLGNIYSSGKTLKSASEFVPRSGDVVVCGPPRGGQTALLHALCSLRSGQVSSKPERVLEETRWLEGVGAAPSSSGGECRSRPGRLIKTHMSPPRGTEDHKIIAVLRDPKDLRVSWFRHVRRLFKKTFKGLTKFDDEFFLNDFCEQVALGALLGAKEGDYEDFVLEVARAPQDQVCIVFYEEIVASPHNVVERIAKFTGWGADSPELVDQVTQCVVQDKLHPSRKKRFGSCGAGADLLSNDVCAKIDEKWRLRVQKKFKQFGEYGDYQQMFHAVTGVPFPFGTKPLVNSVALPPDLPARKSGMGVAGQGARTTSGAAPVQTAGTAMATYPKPVGRKAKFPDPDESDEEPGGALPTQSGVMSRISSRISMSLASMRG
jgi:hypothetical protein